MLPSHRHAGGMDATARVSANQVFTDGTLADLLVTRDSTGQFSAYVDGTLAFSIPDLNSITTFSGPNNIMYFFTDDFQSLATHPTQPEAGSGFIESIQVTVPSAVPEWPPLRTAVRMPVVRAKSTHSITSWRFAQYAINAGRR